MLFRSREIGDHTHKVRDQDQQNELVEPYRLLPFDGGILSPQSGVDYILIKRGKDGDEGVAHRMPNNKG